MPMMSINPKDHPTFQRAMHLAQSRLLDDKPGLRAKIDQLVERLPMPREEAVSIALGEMAQEAYENAIEELAEQCGARVRIEFSCTGHDYLDEMARYALRLNNGPSPILDAIEEARARMPEMVLTIHEFGVREDGLIFGRTYNEAAGGNFAHLQSCILTALAQEAQGSANEDGSAPRRLDGAVGPSLKSMAMRSFPSDDKTRAGRSLCTHVDDLAQRMRRLPTLTFSFGIEPRHSVSGTQAAARLIQIAEAENQMRPNDRAIASLFMELGV